MLGQHIMYDVHDVDQWDMTPPTIEKLLEDCITVTGLKEVGRVSKIFSEPEPVPGYTLAILLSESHITAHTWPEKGAVCIDLFTCRELSARDLDSLAATVRTSLHTSQVHTMVVHRTAPEPEPPRQQLLE